MRDLLWMTQANGPEPVRRPVSDRSARAEIGYCAALLHNVMTLHPVELRDLVARINAALKDVR